MKIENEIDIEAGGYVALRTEKDALGNDIRVLSVNNGVIAFKLLLDNGGDIADIYLFETKMSWERDRKYLIHSDCVNLKEDGWDKGFYAAVASLGPEVFGTPDETCTDHGTGAYSKVNLETLDIETNDSALKIAFDVPIRGYESRCKYLKQVTIIVLTNSSTIVRKEVFENLTDQVLPLDDGYHVQFSGEFAKAGGRYVLPVAKDRMLLRDSAKKETDPKFFEAFDTLYPDIHCYQYIPEAVFGIETIIKDVEFINTKKDQLIAEMIVNNDRSYGAAIIRPRSSFPRTLLAKRNDGTAMYAIEPSKTRPNSLRQKAIDGELFYINPKEKIESEIAFTFFNNSNQVKALEELIERSAQYEERNKESFYSNK